MHHFNIKMTRDEARLADFLNSLDGEVISIIPNVVPFPATYVDFLLIVEGIPDDAQPAEGGSGTG